ncbi:MAG: hypothetical protein M0P01_00615 [Treponema sp.]|nr:hypothetical protein [Treponema sp.]
MYVYNPSNFSVATATTLLKGSKQFIFADCFTLSYLNGVVNFTSPSDGTYSCVRAATENYTIFLPAVYSGYTHAFILREYIRESYKSVLTDLYIQFNNTSDCILSLYICDNNSDTDEDPTNSIPFRFGIVFAKN